MPLNSHEQIPLGRSSQCRFGPAAPGSGRADNQAEDVAAAASEEGGLGGKFTRRAIDSHGSSVSRRRRRKQREGDDQHGAPCGTSNRSPSPAWSSASHAARCIACHDHTQAAGALRSDVSPHVATDLLVGPLFYRMFVRHQPVTDAFVKQVLQYVLEGLQAPRSGRRGRS